MRDKGQILSVHPAGSVIESELAKRYADFQIRVEFTFGRVVLLHDRTITTPSGWIFFYESRAYLASKDPLDRLVANQPFLVSRFDGEISWKSASETLEEFVAMHGGALKIGSCDRYVPAAKPPVSR